MLTLDSYPGRDLRRRRDRGRATRRSPGTTPTSQGLTTTSDAINFKVKVKLLDPPPSIRPGLLGHRRHHHRDPGEGAGHPARGGRHPRLAQGREGRLRPAQDRGGRLHRRATARCASSRSRPGSPASCRSRWTDGPQAPGQEVVTGPFKALRDDQGRRPGQADERGRSRKALEAGRARRPSSERHALSRAARRRAPGAAAATSCARA